MVTSETYRDNGAIGAILDEYAKAIEAVKVVISDISPQDLLRVMDAKTQDEDCKSIQTILGHIVSSGYTYVIEIRKHLGEKLDYKESILRLSVAEYIMDLDIMFAYNIQLFDDFPNIQLEEFAENKKIKTRWRQKYDVE